MHEKTTDKERRNVDTNDPALIVLTVPNERHSIEGASRRAVVRYAFSAIFEAFIVYLQRTRTHPVCPPDMVFFLRYVTSRCFFLFSSSYMRASKSKERKRNDTLKPVRTSQSSLACLFLSSLFFFFFFVATTRFSIECRSLSTALPSSRMRANEKEIVFDDGATRVLISFQICRSFRERLR